MNLACSLQKLLVVQVRPCTTAAARVNPPFRKAFDIQTTTLHPSYQVTHGSLERVLTRVIQITNDMAVENNVYLAKLAEQAERYEGTKYQVIL